jgi:hypothetical protein
MVNPRWVEVGAGREKLVVVHHEVAAVKYEEFLYRRGEKMRCGLDKTQGAEVPKIEVPEGQREKHASAELVGVVGVPGFEDIGKSRAGEITRWEYVNHVVGSRADVKASTVSSGKDKAPKEEACDGETIMKSEIAESFNRDNFLSQPGVQENLGGSSEVVRKGVLEDLNLRFTVRINFPGEEVGILVGLIIQRAPEAGAKVQLEEGQGSLGMFLAGKKKVKDRVRDNDVIVRVVAPKVTRRGGREDVGLRKAREKRKLVVQSDRTKGELPPARVRIHDARASDDHTGANRT